MKEIKSILYRKLTAGDFYNIERQNDPVGGGGQRYFDIPLGNMADGVRSVVQFLRDAERVEDIDPADVETWPELTIEVRKIGEPGTKETLQFKPRRGGNDRYRIANQNRFSDEGGRHPAWRAENGFPQSDGDLQNAVDTAGKFPDIDDGLYKIYVVKTLDNEYYAGFVESTNMPPGWPEGFGLDEMFGNNASGIITFDTTGIPVGIHPIIKRIFEGWSQKPNVLLYGPPGTGKTFAMNELWGLLRSGDEFSSLNLKPDNRDSPFGSTRAPNPLGGEVSQEWVTFHQSYGYEDFILSKRPVPSDELGFRLQPQLGVLLDQAYSVSQGNSNSAVIYVDELNRGNTSRIFGEFITFMDQDYRSEGDAHQLPIPLRSLSVEEDDSGNKVTEKVERLDGNKVHLPVPMYFPSPVFTVASMNSVDRSVAPLDSALARRFVRIDVQPDLALLAEWLGTQDVDALRSQYIATVPEDGDDGSGSPSVDELSLLLLDRLNRLVASLLGVDQRFGHTYFKPVADASGERERLVQLASVWDQSIFPQLRERFVNRRSDLLQVLRLTPSSDPPNDYLLSLQSQDDIGGTLPGGEDVPDVPHLAPLVEQGEQSRVRLTLEYLSGLE
jgi:DNA polymerase III delta prime subunit